MKKITVFSRSTVFVFLIAFVCSSVLLDADQQDQSLLTLDRIFSGREFGVERFGGVQWLEDSTGYTKLESSKAVERGRDIVKYDPAAGKREILVSAERLVPAGESEPLAVQGYFWSKDMKKLLIYTNSRKVWRRNTRGDYWVLDLGNGKLSQLGGEAEPSSLMFAKLYLRWI